MLVDWIKNTLLILINYLNEINYTSKSIVENTKKFVNAFYALLRIKPHLVLSNETIVLQTLYKFKFKIQKI